MLFEEALFLVGSEPTWVLREYLERFPFAHKLRRASLLVLRLRGREL